jgi:hypothetical protein
MKVITPLNKVNKFNKIKVSVSKSFSKVENDNNQ